VSLVARFPVILTRLGLQKLGPLPKRRSAEDLVDSMMALDVQIRAHIAIYAFIVIAFLVAVARAAMKYGALKVLASVAAALRTHCEACSPKAKGADDPAVHQALQVELGRLRVRIARAFFNICGFAAFIVSLIMLNITRLGAVAPSALRTGTVPLLCVAAVVPVLFPCTVTRQTIDLWSCLVQGISAFSLSPSITDNDVTMLYEFAPFVSVTAFFGCTINLKMRVTFWVSAAHTAYILWAATVMKVNEEAHFDFRNRVILIFVGKVFAYLAIETMLVSYARDIVGSEMKRGAMLSLLRMVCDAVVTLDDTGRMQDDERALATMLFLGNDRALVGEKFLQYLQPGTDAERFSAATDPATGKEPCLLHGRLRDAWGSFIKMQLYIVPFRTVGNSSSYLVGVKEESEDYVLRDLPEGGQDVFREDGAPSPATSGQMSHRPLAELSSDIAQAVLEWQEARSLSSASKPNSTSSTESNRMVADVLPEEGLPIRYASKGLARAFPGFERGKPLSPLFPSGVEKLLEWIKERDAAVQSGARHAGAQHYGFMHVGATSMPRREIIVNFPPPSAPAEEGQQQPRRRRVSLKIGRTEPGARIGQLLPGEPGQLLPKQMCGVRSGEGGGRPSVEIRSL